MRATLEVNLGALAANYRLLKSKHAAQHIAAVVKADAYGLGAEAVSRALWNEGCREFFVATLDEAIALRAALPDAIIGVFQGLLPGEERDYVQHALTPVLNDLAEVERFVQGSGFRIQDSGCIIHVDTGMTRLGLSSEDIKKLPSRILNPESRPLLMSHLACANEPQHPKNAEQLARFKTALRHFPGAKASLANSSGIFLGPEFHFDMARPGCALYGITPVQGGNPMQHVATLSAPILQIRTLDCDETVGYGATKPMPKGSRIAICALGYADGWMRNLSNQGHAFMGGQKVALLGRVSMDMVALDVSAIAESTLATARAEFINAQQTVNDIAAAAGTIGYEIFTRIGSRVKRIYI